MKEKLERYYKKYNRREYVHPDPLEFLYQYKNKEDIEIVALIASCLAFGRVSQILKSVSFVLDTMSSSPKSWLKNTSKKDMSKSFDGFVYRFVRNKELIALLYSIKKILSEYGSLENCFEQGLSSDDPTVFNGIVFFHNAVTKYSGKDTGYLFADPLKGSGCKRMNLFLRWMVRNDDVDTGIWQHVSSSKLIVPIDTHMHSIGLKLGFTKRKQANMKTALEITNEFAKISPDDPVKYDFTLTRFGIRNDMSIDEI